MSEDTHAHFLESLEQSKRGVFLIANYLSRHGYNCRLPKFEKAPAHSDWQQFADGGDLFVEQRVEVKHRAINFSGTHDWPFREGFIVCAKHAWDMAKQKPWAFFNVSKDEKAIAIIMGNTSGHWKVINVNDSRRDTIQDCYLCPLEFVKFRKIE